MLPRPVLRVVSLGRRLNLATEEGAQGSARQATGAFNKTDETKGEREDETKPGLGSWPRAAGNAYLSGTEQATWCTRMG